MPEVSVLFVVTFKLKIERSDDAHWVNSNLMVISNAFVQTGVGKVLLFSYDPGVKGVISVVMSLGGINATQMKDEMSNILKNNHDISEIKWKEIDASKIAHAEG